VTGVPTVRSLIRGAAIGVVAALLILAAATVLGLVVPGSRLVFLVGVIAGVLFGLIPKGKARVESMGAAGVGVMAIVAGLATGWGWLELASIAGSVAAVIWILSGQPAPAGKWAWLRWGGVVLPVVAFVILPLTLDGGTLGHDEAAYAVKAKSWLEGTPDTGWLRHRATGMSVYGYAVLSMGGAEGGLRLIGIAGLLAMVSGVWALGYRMANLRVAGIAAIALVAGPELLRRSTEYLSDVPAAALLVWGMVIVWREFAQRDFPTYRLLWFAPLALAAFYLRYQTILSLGLIALVTVILWWPKIRSRPGPVLAMVGLGVLGLIPHALEAIGFEGTPWAIIAYTSGIAERAYVGEGLLDYAYLMAWPMAGFVGPVAAIASVGGAISTWRDKLARERYMFLLIPAVFQVVALGLLSHGEARFVFFPLALIMVSGAISIDTWLDVGRQSWRSAAAIGMGLLVVASFTASTITVRGNVDHRARVNESIQYAAVAARSMSGEESCGVMTTSTPQVTYYSECSSQIFRPGLDPEQAVDGLVGEHKYMILVEGGLRQPTEGELAALVDLTDRDPVLIEGSRAAAVYTFLD
jgi:hypothetical protein